MAYIGNGHRYIYYIHLTNVFIEQVFIFEFDPYADRKSMDKNADFFSLP